MVLRKFCFRHPHPNFVFPAVISRVLPVLAICGNFETSDALKVRPQELPNKTDSFLFRRHIPVSLIVVSWFFEEQGGEKRDENSEGRSSFVVVNSEFLLDFLFSQTKTPQLHVFCSKKLEIAWKKINPKWIRQSNATPLQADPRKLLASQSF